MSDYCEYLPELKSTKLFRNIEDEALLAKTPLNKLRASVTERLKRCR